MKKAVVLLSGGLDSTTTLAVAISEGFSVNALTLFYGQRNLHEIDAAKRIAMAMNAEKHLILKIDLGAIGGSALTTDIAVPKANLTSKSQDSIPITYVPARNTIFLSFALAWAEVIGCFDIFIGANSVDYSGYPDCRPEFIEAFEKMANLATGVGIRGGKFHIHVPLMKMTKGQIIRLGTSLGVDYSLTQSCYDPGPRGEQCGRCESCILRKKGFEEAGIQDPLYRG